LDYIEPKVELKDLLDSLLEAGFGIEGVEDGDDPIIDLEVTPNRPDCLGILGIAREVVAMRGGRLIFPDTSLSEGEEDVSDLVQVTIEDADGCPRYTARVIKGVKVGPSPEWMARRLEAVGMRPINNIVDATNYVLMELGHPLHAFDYDLVGGYIRVRRARDGELILSLDGEMRRLSPEDLVIADEDRAIAIAGVMGGMETGITDSTKNVLLESAYFNPVSIRRTAKRLGMRTEASYRFERGADPEIPPTASARCAKLICEISGGVVAKGVVDSYPKPQGPVLIRLRKEKIEGILGVGFSDRDIASFLERLGFKVSGSSPFLVEVPSFRWADVKREIDLVEEIARVYGYNRIPEKVPEREILPAPISHKELVLEGIRDILCGYGLFETINYSFMGYNDLASMDVPPTDDWSKAIRLLNPISSGQELLRTTLIPGLLRVVERNMRRKVQRVQIFEIGKVFREDEGISEEEMLGIALWGRRYKRSWHFGEDDVDFFDLKGIVEGLFFSMGISADFVRDSHPSFHPGRCAGIFAFGNRIGIMGELHPKLLSGYDIKGRVYVAEIRLLPLIEEVGFEKHYVPIPRYPEVRRDISLIVPEDLPAKEVEMAIREEGGELVEDVILFDLYKGEQIPDGMKALAFSITFRSPERTLRGEEVDELQARIVEAMGRRFGAKLRQGGWMG
jgi:phenylalanyl-tRNA synthetase beta chain